MISISKTTTDVLGPMKNPSHPGDIVWFGILEPLEISLTDAAMMLGVRRATLSDVVNGKASLSAEMAFRLQKAFGVDAACCFGCRTNTIWRKSANMQKASRSNVTARPRNGSPGSLGYANACQVRPGFSDRNGRNPSLP